VKDIQTNFQSFRNIVKGDFVYADKTESVYQLAAKGGAYFLSRPRRFGKSLLLNTFDALFREPASPEDAPHNFFKNLWIGQKATPAYDFTDYRPVINLSLSLSCQSPQILSDGLAQMIRGVAASYGVERDITTPDGMLRSLIVDLKEKYQKKVVLLIDEYDDPIRSNFVDNDLARANLMVLKGFYSALKPREEDLHLVFLTGITRYALLWGSEVINHLVDLTLSEEYANICGFTYEEFENCFADRFPQALASLKGKGTLEKTPQFQICER
jgi:hypothetical protein